MISAVTIFFDRLVEISAQINWMESGYLKLLWLLPVFVFILWLGVVRTFRRMSNVQKSIALESQWSINRMTSRVKIICLSIAFMALVVAVSGPRLGWRWVEGRVRGIDIVVALDVSKSMLAEDLNPSRLERARRMIIDLLEVAKGDRIGLVVFSGSAFVQCPLTIDHGAVLSFLEQIDAGTIPVGGTDLAGALNESLRALGAGGESEDIGSGKLIVLLSDGEDHEGGVDAAIAAVLKSNTKVIAVGLGSTQGSPIPDGAGGFVKDKSGNVVVSKLDDRTLKNIAAATGGYFVDANKTGVAITDLYGEVIKKNTKDRDLGVRKDRVWFERFQWPAALALFLLVLDLGLIEVWNKSSKFLFFIFLAASDPLEASDDRSRYNAAVSALNDGRKEEAQNAFSQLLESSDLEVKRRANYNLGNIFAENGVYQEAVQHYEKALSLDYQDQQVRDNLKWARERAKNKDQQKQDQQKQDQQKQDQQKQDQQKQDQQKQDQQKQEISKDEAERLLRSVPDERKNVRPLYRGKQSEPRNIDQDW